MVNILFYKNHLEKSNVSPWIFSITVILFWKTDLVLSNSMLKCSFFRVVSDFFKFYSLKDEIYSKFGASFPPVAITAFYIYGSSPC